MSSQGHVTWHVRHPGDGPAADPRRQGARARRRQRQAQPFCCPISTTAEVGVDGYAQAGNEPWFGIFAPAGTPATNIDRLNSEFRKALNSPDLSQVMKTQGYDVWTVDPAAFLAFIRDDGAKWGKVVKDVGRTR